MSTPDRYIPGVPCWTDSTQPDPDTALTFYGELFGWEFQDTMPPDMPGSYYVGRIRGEDVAAISSPPPGAPPSAVWNTYVWVADADATASRVRAAGGNVVMEPFDVVDAGRMAVFTDPAGAEFRVWQPREHRGATVVNEHGAVNFNDLHVADLDGARTFYGAVFGWETLDLGGGHMWALPGYGDFLESRSPGLREQMAAIGAPERFEDVVASVVAIPGDGSAAPARWGVTFATNDADATAERAAALGGRVVVPPFDAPWVRMTVVADPGGATFTASQFVPENREIGEATSATAA